MLRLISSRTTNKLTSPSQDQSMEPPVNDEQQGQLMSCQIALCPCGQVNIGFGGTHLTLSSADFKRFAEMVSEAARRLERL